MTQANEGWLSPDDVIADDLLPTDASVELQLKTGELVSAFYGYVEDEDGSPWRAFYDHDGVEIFHLDIEKCRPTPTEI